MRPPIKWVQILPVSVCHRKIEEKQYPKLGIGGLLNNCIIKNFRNHNEILMAKKVCIFAVSTGLEFGDELTRTI